MSWSIGATIAACQQGRKIEAIKQFRSYTGLGLKESKDFIEAIYPYLHNEQTLVDQQLRSEQSGNVQAPHVVLAKCDGEPWTVVDTASNQSDALYEARYRLSNASDHIDVKVARIIADTTKELRTLV